MVAIALACFFGGLLSTGYGLLALGVAIVSVLLGLSVRRLDITGDLAGPGVRRGGDQVERWQPNQRRILIGSLLVSTIIVAAVFAGASVLTAVLIMSVFFFAALVLDFTLMQRWRKQRKSPE